MLVTRRYRFPASHRLHSKALSDETNRDLYGKCNNPYGHGHDYEVEVTVRGPVDARTGRVVDPRQLDTFVGSHILSAVDHRNLNEEVPEFQHLVPTTENLCLIIERRLRAAWPDSFPQIDRIRIYETARNIFQIRVL